MRQCSLDNCTNKYLANGYCSRHLQVVRRHGKLVTTRRDPRPAIIEGDIAKIPLGVNAIQGYAIVDKEFAHLAEYKWFLGRGGYPCSGYFDDSGKKRYRRLHREVMGYDNMFDHISMDKLDNRKTNLRPATYTQNAMNMSIKSNNTSGYKGVSLIKRTGKYSAAIANTHIGHFDTAIEAAKAYNEKAIELFGEYARPNNV